MSVLKHPEEALQTSVIQWFRLTHPKLSAMLVHIPNGQNVGVVRGRKLKAMGLQKGFPDLFLYVPRGTFHGLAIELKADKGVLSAEQKIYLEALCEQGYLAVVCYGFEDTQALIKRYLSL